VSAEENGNGESGDGELVPGLGHLLVVELGFGEQQVPFVAFFHHFVLLLLAGVFFLFLFLRFEPNFLFALFGS
jgi:hypothetical protein